MFGLNLIDNGNTAFFGQLVNGVSKIISCLLRFCFIERISIECRKKFRVCFGFA